MTDNLLASKQAKRNSSLDLYKGICILFVVTTHYAWTDRDRLILLFPFWIDMAVPVFMVITGFVGCLSLENKNLSLKASYNPKVIISKWLRFIIPYTPIWVYGVILRIVVSGKAFSARRLFIDYFIGGTGPGSYYFPVMLQIVLFLPLIRWFMKRNPLMCLGTCFIINVCYEAFKTAINLNPEIYRLCSFRYIFIIAYGCFLFYNEEKKNNRYWYYLFGLLGLIYIVVFKYTGVKPIITDQWTATSVFAVMLIIPVMKHLIKKSGFHFTPLEILGKASFNIFLVQMFFYLGGNKIIYRFIPSIPLRLVVIILICCSLGILFYKIETPITKIIIKKLK